MCVRRGMHDARTRARNERARHEVKDSAGEIAGLDSWPRKAVVHTQTHACTSKDDIDRQHTNTACDMFLLVPMYASGIYQQLFSFVTDDFFLFSGFFVSFPLQETARFVVVSYEV